MSLLISCLLLSVPVILSGIIILRFKLSETALKLTLSFSAAYLLSLSFLHLLPEIFGHPDTAHGAGLYILAGFFIQLLLDYFSTGIEHGHVHHHDHTHKGDSHLPLSVIAGLFLHSFIEGIPVSDVFSANTPAHAGLLEFKQSLILGITLHNIPISIAFMALMLHKGVPKKSAILYLLLFSAMAPLGACFSEMLHLAGIEQYQSVMNIALGIVVGIFLHISTTIMFESSENHRYNFTKLLSIFLGAVLAWIIT